MTDLLTRRSRLSAAKRSLLEERLRGALKGDETNDAIHSRPKRDLIPLSFAQQRLWFIDRLEPDSSAYNVPGAVRLAGKLNLETLERVINEIVRRHEALRTRFEEVEGAPVQMIDEWKPRKLEVVDLTSLPWEEREAEVRRRIREEAGTGFDLSRGPLFRVKVLILGEEQHLALFTLHHIVSDLWSMGILIKEVGALFRAYNRGEASPLPELEIQYADYAVWQRQWLQGEVLDKQLAYWKRQLAGAPSLLQLPTDRPRSAIQTYRGAYESFVLSPELGERLRRLSRDEDVTLFMTTLAGFQLLLARYSGEDRIAVGTPVAGRNRKETEGLIGLFVNTLVMVTDLSGNPTVRELLRQVRETAIGAFSHQDLPFEKLVEELQPERSLNRQPLFQVMFSFENHQEDSLATPNPGAGNERIEVDQVRFELALTIIEEGNRIIGVVEYAVDLYERESMIRLSEHLTRLLETVTADRECRVLDIPLLTEPEWEQVLAWNRTAVEYAAEQRIHEIFEEQAGRAPDRIAGVAEAGEITFGELNRRANQLGAYLRRYGVGAEVRVGICMERGLEMLVGLLGILKAGGAYVPLDPAYPEERLSFMLEDAAVRLIVTQEKLGGLLRGISAVSICIDGDRDEIALESEENIDCGVKSENLAYVIYTSGSTGRPKGTMITHRSVVNLVSDAVRKFRLEQDSRFLQFASLSFDVTVEEIYPALSIGGSVVLQSDNMSYSYSDLARTIERREVTTVELPTVYWCEWMRELSRRRTRAPRCLALVIIGGERVSPEILKEWKEHDAPLLHVYGVTEAAVTSMVYPVPRELSAGSSFAEIPIGSPMANTEVYLLDKRLGPMPPRIPSEMYLGGVGAARGYLNRPELTAESFVPSPFGEQPGSRLYKTGDLARCAVAPPTPPTPPTPLTPLTPLNGCIEFVGRIDHQVKIRGFRVELGEIEAVLNEHGSVKQSVVVASEDERGGQRLIGYVVGGDGATAQSLKRHVRERLPEYMVPEAILLLEEIPLTANGKIDRKRLPEVKGEDRETEQEYVIPRTPAEEILAGIFEEVLKLERVGIRDDFFELGGHSLLATQVVSRVGNTLGVEIGVGSIFENRTVERIASRIEEAVSAGRKEEKPPLVKALREDQSGARLPLSFAQQRLWFLDQLLPNNHFYNILGAVRLAGSLDLKALERSVNEIVRRHEVLRTRIEIEAGEPAQVIDEWEPRRLEVVDLTSLPLEERETEIGRTAREEAGTGFDLSQGPLLRVKVLKLEEEAHVALFTMHHIVSDGWSMGILVREAGALYRAYSAGEPSPLEELPIQYADFAVWQRQWLQGEVLEKKLEYWRNHLAGMEDLDLPTDHPRPATRSYRGGSLRFVADRELTRKLRELGRREGVTLFMTLLGGFDVLMSRYSGQHDIALGTDIANRNREEVEGLIGFFVNQLVMRVEVRPRENFSELLKRVREVCLEAYAHQDVPFEKLVEELRPERDLSHSPLFQTKLILENAPREGLDFRESRSGSAGAGEVRVGSETHISKFDLMVSIMDIGMDIGRDLVGGIEYSRDLYEEGTIERLMSHYMNLLRAVVEESEKPISELSLLSEKEREQIVVEWNETGRSYPQDRHIHQLFAEQAERTPDQIALMCEGQWVSYRELDRRANRLAHYLQGLGVGPEALVGVCLERSVDMVTAVMGALKSGGAYLPLDPEFPPERLAFMLDDAGARVALTRRKSAERLQAFSGQAVCLDEEWEKINEESECEPESGVAAENPVYMIYTSGSTGRPKGVMVRHRSLVNYTLDICRQLGLSEGEGKRLQFATVSTITADLGNTCIYPSLVSGGCLHILNYETATDGARYEEYLKGEPIDVLKIVPSHLNALLGTRSKSAKMLPSKYLILGGEALSYDLAEQIKERGEGCTTINHYGPTETTIGSLTARVSEMEVELRRGAGAPIGRPIANTQSYVLDQEMNPAPVGVRGELHLSGEGLARGYLGRPELTAERFIPNLFSREGGERLYRTGDVVRYRSDGKIGFVGRTDDQVKVRGYRVELGEIEAVLNEHRGVRQSVVLAREDERGDKRLVGYVVGEDDATPTELKRYLQERLPEYMVPEPILALEEIPVTANGKIDRKRLLALSDARHPMEEGIVRPRDVFEHRLLKIWESVLEIHPISVKDNFFDLGGHSILAVILMARIQNEFGRELPLSALFQGGTIEHLAMGLRREAGSMSWSCLVEFQAAGPRMPLFFVHPGGGNVFSYYDLARSLGPDQPFYAFQAPGLYKEQALLTSIEELAAQYIEALRANRPEGPYFLGGWSLGGIIAFEMAQQLIAQNQRVSQLLVLDTYAPISMEEYIDDYDDHDEREEDAVLLLELFEGGLQMSKEELEPFEGDERLDYVLKRGVSVNLFPPDVTIVRARNYLELFRTNARARRNYVPRVYPGTITLFKPVRHYEIPPSDGSARHERIAKMIQDPTDGWGDLAARGVRVVEVPGNHRTMVGKPHVETLALRIRECLDETETPGG